MPNSSRNQPHHHHGPPHSPCDLLAQKPAGKLSERFLLLRKADPRPPGTGHAPLPKIGRATLSRAMRLARLYSKRLWNVGRNVFLLWLVDQILSEFSDGTPRSLFGQVMAVTCCHYRSSCTQARDLLASLFKRDPQAVIEVVFACCFAVVLVERCWGYGILCVKENDVIYLTEPTVFSKT